jgi:hypothetical protein
LCTTTASNNSYLAVCQESQDHPVHVHAKV